MKSTKGTLLLFALSVILLTSIIAPASGNEANSSELSVGCRLSSGESKTVPFCIRNTDSVGHRYQLTAEGAANSYQMYFVAGGVPTKLVTVPSGANSQVELNISLKGNAAVRADQLSVKAIRDDGQAETTTLSVLINQDYVLTASGMLSKLDLLNGKRAELSFAVKNEGSKELKSVRLEPELPYKWISSQDSAINLKPGATGMLKLTVEVPTSQVSGNFTVKVTAVSAEAKSGQISVPVTIRTSSNIAYWMIGALLITGVFTLMQFKRHGRR